MPNESTFVDAFYDERNDDPAGTAGGPSRSEEAYSQLIYRALMKGFNYTMTLQEIYDWIQTHAETKIKPEGWKKINDEAWKKSVRHNLSQKKINDEGWMKSVRHNLSQNEAFEKTGTKTQWRLTDWAVMNGVQSTSKFRKKNPSYDH